MRFEAIIESRRDGNGNTPEELDFLAAGAASGEIPDYQLSAWLMAEFFQSLSLDETAWLTQAMANTGERVDLSGLPKPWIDKHSTGGVGDKTTLVLLPILASCGLTVVKMSGRGLGITGGTVDKLESIPGFRMDLSPDEVKSQAGRIGLAITGQSGNLAPADKALYALRDVTATVDSIPLIASSILSKKLAGGAEMIVLDVKCGSGAFMTDIAGAQALAECLNEVGGRVGLPTSCVITQMDEPLGRAVGNLLEVREAIEVLSGAESRFYELCVKLAGHALHVAGRASSLQEGEDVATACLSSGSAFRKANEWFAAQGADPAVLDNPALLPSAPVRLRVSRQGEAGWVSRVDARIVGEAVIDLGGGRRVKTDRIDPTVGVECLKHVGDRVEAGEAVFVVHAADEVSCAAAVKAVGSAMAVSPQPTAALPLVLA